MKYEGPYRYTLYLKGSAKSRSISRRVSNGIECEFRKPVSSPRQPKLYILLRAKRVVYVGYTSQSIGVRLNGGLKASGAQGYHGYQWKQFSRVGLLVFCFPPFSGDKKRDLSEKHFVTAVEAELAYLIRKKTRRWPESQNEVHFSNRSRNGVLRTSEKIFKILMRK